MDEATMYLNNDYRPYLIHHGVPGQKWGVRKAAWYPISAFQKAKAAVGSKVAEFRQKRADEKKRKQRVANLAKARATRAAKLKEEKDFAEEKKRILTSGTPGEVLKISSKLTDKEIQDATIRNKNLENLRSMEKTRIDRVKAEEFNRKYGKYIKMVETAKLVGGYANDVTNAYKNVKGFLDIFGNKDKDSDNQQKQDRPKEQQKQDKQDKPKAEKADNNQRGDFKSKVVDGEWSEIVTPENVSTALTVVNRAMDSYDSAKSSKAVQNGMKLLEQKKYANLILEPGVDDDKRRK